MQGQLLDLWDIFANVNKIFGLFATHAFTDFTTTTYVSSFLSSLHPSSFFGWYYVIVWYIREVKMGPLLSNFRREIYFVLRVGWL